jgi:hypothetical protein
VPPDGLPTIAHFGFDTLPRVVAAVADGRVELVVPFRIDARAEQVLEWRVRARVGGVPCPTRGRTITAGFVAGLRRRMQQDGMFDFERLPPYLGMEARMGPGVTYVEGRVLHLTPGAHVAYRLEATVARDGRAPAVVRSPEYTTYAVAPTFGPDEIRRTFVRKLEEPLEAWVLSHRRADGLDHVRLDVVAIEGDDHVPGLADLAVTIGGTRVDLRRADLTALPLVDPSADSVVFTVPAGADLPSVDVSYHGVTTTGIDLAATVDVGRARVMFVNFAIQGLNDYFATPDTTYSPPRTYTQLTMRDDKATFCSRPGTPENGSGDGYAFALEAHRRHGVKQLWAMNGALLTLLAHDCPEDLELLRRDVDSGLVVPVVAGFGAHRLPYYSAATNADAIRLGIAAMDGIVGAHSNVYYPDSRIYVDVPAVVDALRATGVEYLVLDADHPVGTEAGAHNTVVTSADPPLSAHDGAGRWIDFQYLWRERRTGAKVLFIDREMKDGLLRGTDPANSDADADRGKVSVNIRRKFLSMAVQPRSRKDNLLVYSDDADKAGGNGWFDGDGVALNKRYQAALWWIRRHPWVQVVTTDDLSPADCVGTIEIKTASDPYIEREWRLPGVDPAPGYDFGLAFDTWYAKWAAFPVAWLGETLDAITRRAEAAVEHWPVRNRMVDLARAYLTLNLHESQWSKKARPNAGVEPEDFVVSESVQLRNTHVYLAAAVWADWAAPPGEPAAYRDRGPVVERVAALSQAPAPWRRPDAAGLQWDHDPLPCIVLYNTRALAVIDRNGGRVTHLFCLVDGLPYAVSGTFKAYQFLEVDWASGAGAECDGVVLQNTVQTPNHLYVAGDVAAGRGTFGEPPAGDGDFDWIYPDNFNAFDVVDAGDGPAPWVTLEYGPGTPDAVPDTLEALDALLVRDREEKVAVRRGVVLHDTERFGTFRKTIRLEGATLRVDYTGTRPGHVVANEFCVDLWSAAIRGRRQSRTVGPDRRSITLANGPAAVTVTTGRNCGFTPATLAPPNPPTVETLRLRRVLTDALEIVAPDGGDFSYTVALGSPPG